MRRGLRWACLWLALWTGQLASAQEGQTHLSGADQEARALFMAAQVAFDEGRFESAVQYFLQSYRLSARPELLYNIGNTYDRLQQPEQALDYFDRYLRERPNADNHLQVEARARLLRQSVDARRAQPTPPNAAAAPAAATVPTPQQAAQAHLDANEAQAPAAPAPEAATRDDDSGPNWWLWSGVGAAVIAATVVTVVIATSGSTTQDPLVPQDGTPVVRL